MKVPGIVRRHPELRWLASVAAIVAVVAGVTTTVSGVFRTSADPLPTIGSQQLLSDIRTPYPGGYVGTIVMQLDLELPAPARLALAGAVPSGGSLVDGSHTLRYWYGGPDEQRVAVLGHASEVDVFRNRDRVWQWDSKARVALHATVPSGSGLPLTLAMPAALTPPELVRRLLHATGTDSTTVLRHGPEIADRPTYELMITPRPHASRVGKVIVYVDGVRHVPLGVRVYARGADGPAIDVAFTSVRFARPQVQTFTFAPPVGATVRSGSAGLFGQVMGDVRVSGTGWLSLLRYRTTQAQAQVLGQLLSGSLRRVKGHWGKGQLLVSPLVCALITDDGRIAAGAVDPSVLYAAVRNGRHTPAHRN